MSCDIPNFDDQVTDMTKRARKDDEEDRPRRYRIALEEIRYELREFWGGPPYDRGDKLPATLAREECRQLMTAYTSGNPLYKRLQRLNWTFRGFGQK